MSKLKSILIFFILLAFLLPSFVFAQETPVNVYFFWGEGCPHCAKEKEYLQKIENNYPQVIINNFEVYNNRQNAKLLQKIGQETDINVNGVPLIIIGDKALVGFLNEETTGQQIRKLIDECLANKCPDLINQIINQTPEPAPQPLPEPKKNNDTYLINLPLIGEIDAKAFSLPVLTIIIAAIDGFNPCAMWVLLFLISLLLGMENKKRMWALGSAFILASGIVYFLFLSAWLNLFLFIGFIFWVRIIIGLIAIGSGSYHLWDFYKNRPGCKVVKGELREKVFTNLKFITKIPSFGLALLGMIIIAFAVNLIELVCSAGLPAIYTNVLSLSDISTWQYYLLLILYIIIFMLDDMFVFAVAMLTLRATGISTKYTRYANLIGGIIILILGILLILKPEWLMFS
jgi:thiol-disulfide isomerase/thioredoxin